jgi:hypothetical protein
MSNGNKENIEDEDESSPFQKWSRAQNFAFNLILDFLKLKDIVKMLTIYRTARVRIIPSALLLSEILQKALPESFPDFPYRYYRNQSCVKVLQTLLMISGDKNLTLRLMRELYNSIKSSIKNEF